MKPVPTSRPDPWHFARPELAQNYLHAFDLKLSSARGLFARRRMGKTEFLLNDLRPAAQVRGYMVAYANLWDSRLAPDTALLAAVTKALAPRGVKAVLTSLRPPVRKFKAGASLPGMEGSLEAELSGAEDRPLSLPCLLEQIDKQKKPLLLLIDETQVLAREEHSNFAHALRAALDTRKDRVKVIFAGSSETTLREMFARASEPFYNWAPLEPFPLLGEEFVHFTIRLMNSMARTTLTQEQGMHVFAELHNTPEFFKRFVERYMLYQVQGLDAALNHTRASVFSEAHFLLQWQSLDPAARATLVLVAHGESIIAGSSSLKRLSDILGQKASDQIAADALSHVLATNILSRLSIGEYRIEDEAFAEWIRRKTYFKR